MPNTRKNIKKQEKQEKEYNQSKSDCFKQKDDNSLQIGKCQAKISNYDVIEEQFNKKYEEKLCRNILGVYETGTLELRDDEYKKEISKIQKDIVSLKQEKVKNDDDFVKYVRKQDDLRNEIMEKKSKLASEREICLDFEEQLKIRQDIMKHFLVSENDVYNKEVILKGADRKLKEISAAKRLLERESEQTNTEIKLLENGRLLEVSKEFDEYLSSMEIEYIYGMEWLSNNGRSMDENKKIAANNPFIPYAVIISGEDLKKLLADKNKVFTSNPVPIVKREELEDGFINDETGVVELEKISFYLKFQEQKIK